MSSEGEQKDDIFTALSHPVRREILVLLRERGALPVCVIAAEVQRDRYATARHLGTLESAGLIVSQRRGRSRILALQPRPFLAVEDWVIGFTDLLFPAADSA
ncbi:ArsR/SmtB family transcription factor [Microbacterium sp. 179-B 1A2 NHS]|uniref:ArsR/SmtB family transcription factor n=1 Tax=Microbacterium sp. 179-B 1A2 NHS TaxID=3142383 RepID=UPI0039A09FBB